MSHNVSYHGGNVDQFARKYGFNLNEILDYSSNINPVPLPDKLKMQILQNIDVLRRYPDRDYHELRKALSEYTGSSEEWIMVGNGATELLYLAAKALKPEKVLIPAPSFGDYERSFFGTVSKVDFYRVKEELDFRLDVESFLHKLKDGYKMTILCNPNNPTGYLIPKEDLIRILDEAKEMGVIVILDETFIEFTYPDSVSIIRDISAYDNVVVLRALTKFFAVPGLRLGYCLAHPVLLEQMNSVKEPWMVNAIANLLGPYLLRDEDFIHKTRDWIMTERPYMYERLQRIEGIKVYESFSSFFLIKLLKEKINVDTLQEMLSVEQIMIRDASSFRYLDKKYVRLAVKDRESNSKLLDCLEYYI